MVMAYLQQKLHFVSRIGDLGERVFDVVALIDVLKSSLFASSESNLGKL